MSATLSLARVLQVHRPAGATRPLVFDSPHSGNDFPDDFGSVLDIEQLRTAEDCYVHELWAGATTHGAQLLEALFPRSYIDPNRSAGDIDLELLDAPWPHDYQPSGKARTGNALVWRNLDDGTPIYAGRLSVQTLLHRIENYLRPYQAALQALLDQAHAAHGVVYHINCHSMNPVGGAMGEGGAGSVRADVVLGDRDGTSCEAAFTETVRDFFRSRGYSVAINGPFKGVELVRMFSAPREGRHSLQVELNKRLYMEGATLQRSAGFARLRSDLDELAAQLSRFASRHDQALPRAVG